MREQDKALYTPQSPLTTAIGCNCPRCGQGKLFSGFLKTAPRCSSCGLDFKFIDSGDGPAVFIIMIVGFIVVGAVMVVEIKYMPPIWLHMVMWLPLTLILALGMLRPLKTLMIALQYKHNAQEGRLSE